MKKFTFTTFVGTKEGLPQIGTELVRGLLKAKVEFDFYPHGIVGDMPVDLAPYAVKSQDINPTLPVVAFRDLISEVELESDIVFTMWETNRIPDRWVTALNQRKAIIVPCEWNRDTLIACGVNVPIYKCPLGVDETIFNPQRAALPLERPFAFGCSGRDYGKGKWTRKNLPLVVKAFHYAFSGKENVSLDIKIDSDNDIDTFKDKRIKVWKGYWPTQQLANWLKSLDVFVSAASSEGWGLLQHQALACGTALVSPFYGGVTEFFRPPDVGYTVDFDHVPVSGLYKGKGTWPMPSVESLGKAMNEALSCTDVVERARKYIGRTVEAFTLTHMQQTFVNTLAKVL